MAVTDEKAEVSAAVLWRALESANCRSGWCESILETDGHSGENSQMVAAEAGGEPRLGSMGGEAGWGFARRLLSEAAEERVVAWIEAKFVVKGLPVLARDAERMIAEEWVMENPGGRFPGCSVRTMQRLMPGVD